MKRHLFAILCLSMLGAGVSFADEEILPTEVKSTSSQREILGQFFYSPELRYERGDTQEWQTRTPLNMAVGVRTSLWSFLLEYSRFENTTGNATLNIQRAHHEALFWGQRDVWHYDILTGWSADLYLGFGAGAFQEEVTTRLLSSSSNDKSKWYAVGGASMGLQSRWFLFSTLPNLGFSAGLEARVLFSQEFDPNPQGSFLGRFGILF